MAITIFHRTTNRVKIINDGTKKADEIYQAKINEKTHARRVVKNVRNKNSRTNL